MDKWDRRFIERAQHIASWSKDPSSQVGAVIVDGKHSVSEGYNGPPSCWEDDPELPRSLRLKVTIHAEENALLLARRDLRGMTAYVTHWPCASCAAKLTQAGIVRVVLPEQDVAFLERWDDHIDLATSIFRKAGVRVEVLHG